jgi:cell division septation protein DedD
MTTPRPAGTAGSLSVRQLALLFFLAVAVCAVFFALGFVVGNNQNASRGEPTSEQVAPHSEVPPTVNPSAQQEPPPTNPPRADSKPGASSIVEQDLNSGAAPPTPVAPVQQIAPEMSHPPQTTAHSPRSEATSGPVRSSEPRGIMVQVAASHGEAHARSLTHRLRARGFPALLIGPGSSGIYRVQVGPYRSRRAAANAAARLRRDGFRPFVR